MNREENIIIYNNMMEKFKRDCNKCTIIECKEMHESVINQWYHKLYDELHKN